MEDTNDLVTKEFEAYPDVAADIINAVIHHGKQVVQAEQLVGGPTESIYQGKKSLRSQLEDVCKYELQDGQINILYMFANQTRVDDGMLLRKAGYTGGVYREQYDGKIKDVYPVVELVLYWGEGTWKGAKTMERLLRDRKISEEMWEYIDNFRLHVFEMRYLSEEQRRFFTGDMRIIVDYLAEGIHYRSDRKIMHKASVIKMIRILSGENDVDDTESLLEEMNIREEDEIAVCELFDQYTRRGVRQGIKEGIKEGIKALIITCKEFNVGFNETAEKVKERFQLNDDEVQENMRLYW